MKKIVIYLSIIVTAAITFSCTKDFLTKTPFDSFDDEDYWAKEANLRAYAQGMYMNTATADLSFFTGYGTDYTVFGGFFVGDRYNDDVALTTPGAFPTTTSAAAGTWNFTNVRKSNVMIEKIPQMDMTDEARNHWMGIARFFRAMSYSILVKRFGDVPYYDHVPLSNDFEDLYRPRDPRTDVVDRIMEDFQFAIANIRENDGVSQINKYVAAAYMSRWMLFHATWLKYHGTTVGPTSQPVADSKLKAYFEAAIAGANTVMTSGKFAIGNTYNELFTSDDLKDNKEVIFYREYAAGKLTHALMSYNNGEAQAGGLSKDCADAYLCEDGLPIGQSPLYAGVANSGRRAFADNRDPRLYQCFVDTVRLKDLNSGYSPTGYACKKFLNEEWKASGSAYASGSNSPNDSPIMRYAEVLLNYVEARYEISKVGGAAFSQADLDATINKIRGRQLKKRGTNVAKSMPTITLSGSAISVNGTIIDDPKRDPSVDPVLWEIRRERRIELLMEGRRNEDLMRWAKYEYLSTGDATTPKEINMGAWVIKADIPLNADGKSVFEINPPATAPSVTLYYPTADRTAGYIWPCYLTLNQRTFTKGNINSERVYLSSIPTDQINIYTGNGHSLPQNPGWE